MNELKLTEKALEAYRNEIQNYAIDVKASNEEVAKIYANAKMEMKKVVAGQKGSIPYSYIKSLRHKHPFKKIAASITTGNSGVDFLGAYQNRKIYRELVQDHVTIYDYDRVQRVYVDYVGAWGFNVSAVAETAAKPQDTISLTSINFQTTKVAGYIFWTQELERFTDFEDFLLEQVVYHIESKVHWLLLQTWAAAAAAPAYPGAGGYTNTPNTFTLAMFLNRFLTRRPIVERGGCDVLVFYPENTFNSMEALGSPLTLMPVAEQYRSYIANALPNLEILPHDINDGAFLPNSYLAINACSVFPSVSSAIIKEVDIDATGAVTGLPGTSTIPRNVKAAVYEAFVNAAYIPTTTININGTPVSIPTFARDTVANGLANI